MLMVSDPDLPKRLAEVTFTGPDRVRDVLHNFSPHHSTKTNSRVGDWSAENNVELAYVLFYGFWLNRIEARFTALRYIGWRNHHAVSRQKRRQFIAKAETIKKAKIA